MTERVLGLDINKSSIGWSLIEYDPKDDKNNLIVDCDVYEFKAGDMPKTGESPNTPRIRARTKRNTIRKRRIRKNEIRKLFGKNHNSHKSNSLHVYSTLSTEYRNLSFFLKDYWL